MAAASPAANDTANATAVAGVAQPMVTAQSEPAPPPACTELFCPIYSLAVTPDPLLVAANESAQPDIYMADTVQRDRHTRTRLGH